MPVDQPERCKFMGFVICLLLPAVAWAADASPKVLRAGAAVADVTPQKWPVPLVGNFSPRGAARAWDPLRARALVLDNGQTRLAFVVVDSCYCPRSLFDEAKRRAAKLTGILPEHILTAATHTHSAPASRDRRETKADRNTSNT